MLAIVLIENQHKLHAVHGIQKQDEKLTKLNANHPELDGFQDRR
jgi:hypothetical protein